MKSYNLTESFKRVLNYENVGKPNDSHLMLKTLGAKLNEMKERLKNCTIFTKRYIYHLQFIVLQQTQEIYLDFNFWWVE